jgi:hypothetical protein
MSGLDTRNLYFLLGRARWNLKLCNCGTGSTSDKQELAAVVANLAVPRRENVRRGQVAGMRAYGIALAQCWNSNANIPFHTDYHHRSDIGNHSELALGEPLGYYCKSDKDLPNSVDPSVRS